MTLTKDVLLWNANLGYLKYAIVSLEWRWSALLLEIILLGLFLALAGMIMAFAPQIGNALLGMLGGESGAYTLLIQLPIIPEPSSSSPTGYVWPGTNVPFNPGEAGFIGPAAYTVFMLIRNISLMFFALVLIIAAICYITESFRMMREGTALSIITESVFALIMIFMALPIYNTIAALFNELTKPGGPILGQGMIGTVVGRALYTGGGFGLEIIVQFFGAVFFLALTAIVLIVAGVLGIMRLFMIGALTATLPLWIILRAMPPTRRVGESMIEQIIGLILASLISAIIFRFGFEVTSTGFQGLMGTMAALATLLVAAFMPTVMAPRLGGLMMTGAMAATAAVTTATQATIGAVTGGLSSLGGALMARKALQATGQQAPGAKEITSAFARGMLSGFKTGATTRPFSFGGFVGLPSPSVAVDSAREGYAAGREVMFRSALERAGSSLEGLAYDWGSTPMPGESASAGLSWYESIKDDPEAIGREFANVYPEKIRNEMFKSGEDYAALGQELKPLLDEVAAKKPIILHRIKGGLDRIGSMSDEDKAKMLNNALENLSKNKDRFEKVLGSPVRINLEKFDKVKDYYRRVFAGGEVPEYYAKTVGGTTYYLMSEGYDHNNLDPDAGKMLLEQWLGTSEGKTLTDEEAGKWVSENITPIPKEYWRSVGHNFKQMMVETASRNPRLIHNFFNNLENAKLYGKMPNPNTVRYNYDVYATKVQNIADYKNMYMQTPTLGQFFSTQPTSPSPQPSLQPSPLSQQSPPPQQQTSQGGGLESSSGVEGAPPPPSPPPTESGVSPERGQIVTQKTESQPLTQPQPPEGERIVQGTDTTQPPSRFEEQSSEQVQPPQQPRSQEQKKEEKRRRGALEIPSKEEVLGKKKSSRQSVNQQNDKQRRKKKVYDNSNFDELEGELEKRKGAEGEE